MSQYQRPKLILPVTVYIAYLLRRNTILTFQKQRIVKIQKDSLFVYIQHLLPESLGIMKSVYPSMEMILHLKWARRDGICYLIQRRIILGITKIIIILIYSWQLHVKHIKHLFSVQLTKVGFKVSPQIWTAPSGHRIAQSIFVMSVLVWLHTPKPAYGRWKASFQRARSKIQVEIPYCLGTSPIQIATKAHISRFSPMIAVKTISYHI